MNEIVINLNGKLENKLISLNFWVKAVPSRYLKPTLVFEKAELAFFFFQKNNANSTSGP